MTSKSFLTAVASLVAFSTGGILALAIADKMETSPTASEVSNNANTTTGNVDLPGGPENSVNNATSMVPGPTVNRYDGSDRIVTTQAKPMMEPPPAVVADESDHDKSEDLGSPSAGRAL